MGVHILERAKLEPKLLAANTSNYGAMAATSKWTVRLSHCTGKSASGGPSPPKAAARTAGDTGLRKEVCCLGRGRARSWALLDLEMNRCLRRGPEGLKARELGTAPISFRSTLRE